VFGHRLAAPEATRDAQRAGARLRSRAPSGIHDPAPKPSHLLVREPYHHIVATKSGTAVKIYVDGVQSTVLVSPVQVVQNTVCVAVRLGQQRAGEH